jgi:DNA polymerase-3 subunit delta
LLYILSGEDDYSINEEIKVIKNCIGDESLLAINTTVLDGRKLSAEQLVAVAETVPFLAPKRLVIVSGLLERFQSRAIRVKKRETSVATLDPEPFGHCLNSLPSSTELVLIENQVTKSNPLLKQIASVAQLRSFPILRGEALSRWIKNRVDKGSGSISPRAVELLGRLVGGNLWIMASEIDKLALYTSGRQISEDDISTVVGYVQQANVFAMVDAILEFRPRLAQESLQKLLKEGVSSSYLLFMLLRQARLVLRARELKRLDRTSGQIQQALNLSSEFLLRKTIKQASGYSFERLREIYQKLLETDLDIKTGRRNAELALNILAIELCQQR